MHSNIYQISSKPICPDDYASPDMYYDNSSDFADYIGDAYEGEEREERIENFGRIISDVSKRCKKKFFCFQCCREVVGRTPQLLQNHQSIRLRINAGGRER